MTVDETNEKIKAKLRSGVKPKDIAEQVGVPVHRVYTQNRELKMMKDDELVAEVLSEATEKPEIMQEILTEMKASAPSSVVKTIEEVEVGIEGLKKLDSDFQATFTLILNSANKRLTDEGTTLQEWKSITDTLAKAYESIFTKGTSIHIGDNNSMSSQRLTVFKNDMGT